MRALRQENEQLVAEIARLRASTAFRVGHALTRTARRVLPAGRVRQKAVTQVRTRTGAMPSAATRSTPSAGAAEGDTTAGLVRPPSRPVLPALSAAAAVRDRPTVRPLPVPDPAGLVPDGPVFVGGTGRSGTWVIGRMLGAHPHWVNIHTELRFHAGGAGFAQVLAGEITPNKFSKVVVDRHFRVMGGGGKAKGLQIVLEANELTRRLRTFRRDAEKDVADALGCLFLDLLEPYVRGRGGAGWSETTPDNAAAADALLTVLPRARLVHMVRDGRDVAASVSRMPWGPDTMEQGLEWWAARVWEAHLATAAADQDRVLTVRLEELVHLHREREYARLLAFLPFADDSAIRRYFDDKVDAAGGNVGRWRGQATRRQRRRIDGRYHDLLDELRDGGVTCLPTPPEDVDAIAAAN